MNRYFSSFLATSLLYAAIVSLLLFNFDKIVTDKITTKESIVRCRLVAKSVEPKKSAPKVETKQEPKQEPQPKQEEEAKLQPKREQLSKPKAKPIPKPHPKPKLQQKPKPKAKPKPKPKLADKHIKKKRVKQKSSQKHRVKSVKRAIKKGSKSTRAQKRSGLKKTTHSNVSQLGVHAKKEYLQKHYSTILSYIQDEKFYPRGARKLHITGSIVVTFLLKRSGRVVILNASPEKRFLTKAAKEIVLKASRNFPRPPKDMTIRVTLSFTLVD